MRHYLPELATATNGALVFGKTAVYAVKATCPTCQHENVADLKRERGLQKIRKCASCKEPYYTVLGNDVLTRAIVKRMLRKARGDAYC